MATAELFNRDVKANKSPRNAFDMSYSSIFSSPVGQLLPSFVLEVKRGDKVKLGLSNITRTRPLNTSAFMTFDEKTDFWFVPYNLLWSDYDNWRLGQTYRHRTTQLEGAGKQYYLPFTSYADIAGMIKNYKFDSSIPDQSLYYFNPSIASLVRYMDLLGYGVPGGTPTSTDDITGFSQITPSDEFDQTDSTAQKFLYDFYIKLHTSVPRLNYFRLAAFQAIYMHCYRNEEYEQLDPSYYNVDNLFDNLTYDNGVAAPSKDYSNQAHLSVNTDVSDGSLAPRVTLYKLFTPRFKNWRKDVFTSLKPTTGFERTDQDLPFTGLEFLSSINQSGQSLYPSISAYPIALRRNGNASSGNNVNVDASSYNYGGNISDTSDFSFNFLSNNPAVVYQRLFTHVSRVSDSPESYGVSNLFPWNVRNLMAQDKFTRSVIYADKDYESQVKALFGEYEDEWHKPVYLGSYSTNLSINDVTATSAGQEGSGSTASSSVLGQIAGKIYNGDGKPDVFSRNFDYDGIIMGVHYIMPRNNYDSNRLSRWNTKLSRWDYFYPQFDGLGLSPVFAFERNLDGMIQVAGTPPIAFNPSTLLGYAPRYHEYKTRVNEVHGSFMNNQPDYDWTVSNNQYGIASGSQLLNFKVSPLICNRIFSVAYNGSIATDQFLHYYNYDVTKVSDMEVYGTPNI